MCKTMFKKHKKTITTILVITAAFGMIGCMYMFFYGMVSKTELYHKQKPLHDVGRITVDNQDNVYLQLSSYSAVQVYNNEGEFLYGVSYRDNSRGLSDFIIEDGLIDIYTYKIKTKFVFSEKGLEEKIKLIKPPAWYKPTGMLNRRVHISDSGDIYRYHSIGKRVVQYEGENGEKIRTIKINALKWPWSFETYFSFCWISGFILSILLMSKESREKWHRFWNGQEGEAGDEYFYERG